MTNDGPTDAEKHVRQWLAIHGAPLEMRVGRAFRLDGFDIRQSAYYKSDDGVRREIDVLALRRRIVVNGTIQKRRFDRVYCDLLSVVECKAQRATPWVALSHEPSATALVQRKAQHVADAKTLAMMGDISAPLAAESSGRIVYSLAHAKIKKNDRDQEGKSEAYEALCQVTEAATALGGASADSFRLTRPVLVVSAPIVECWLEKDDADLSMRRVDQVTIHWQRSSSGRSMTIVDVVTETGLPAYIRRISAYADAMFKAFADKVAP